MNHLPLMSLIESIETFEATGPADHGDRRAARRLARDLPLTGLLSRLLSHGLLATLARRRLRLAEEDALLRLGDTSAHLLHDIGAADPAKATPIKGLGDIAPVGTVLAVLPGPRHRPNAGAHPAARIAAE